MAKWFRVLGDLPPMALRPLPLHNCNPEDTEIPEELLKERTYNTPQQIGE
jgi:hypothetical protein